MDPARLGQLIDRHAAALELYARPWCDSPEDVVQEAFVKLAGQRVEPEQPAAWLFRVVRHGALNAGRAARRRRRREADASGRAAAWFEPDPGRPDAPDPDEAARALEALPAEEREVIVAHLWGGLTFAQVAAVRGGSASTAHRLYQAGLARLREGLGASSSCPTTHDRSTIPG
jgi:RNA polymerase sigma-70 factor (ECF subfamily)